MTAAVLTPRARFAAERRFYLGITLAMVAVVYVGFARSFFLRPWFPDYPAATEPIFVLHGTVFAAWCVLLVAQATLITAGRVGLHRSLGAAGVGLAVAMVVLGVAGSLLAANRATGFVGVPVPPLQFLIVPIIDMVLFAGFVALAIARRRDAQAHKRWMLLATINLLGAAIARWPGVPPGPLVFFGLADLFIVALAVWDLRSRGKLHPVTVVGGLVLVISQPLRFAVSDSAAWLGFAAWLTGLAA
jgi:uncharacterized membrane protein YozB (DUF420 family)